MGVSGKNSEILTKFSEEILVFMRSSLGVLTNFIDLMRISRYNYNFSLGDPQLISSLN